ncbi:MAG: DVUA0089 family protein [Myxococcales bacterium]|nr:DVUA0089 family protein [Myxococcales bacterium]
MRLRGSWVVGAMLVGGAYLMGCSSSGGNGNGGGTDSGATTDATAMDGGRGDAGPVTDRGPTTDRVTTTDRGPAVTNPCAADAQIDLTTRTPDAMGMVIYAGNNSRAPETGGIAAPAGCLGGQNMPTIAHQVVHRYRMRSTAVLQATTVSKATLETLDTVVAITSACSTTGMSLGCNDDVSQQILQSNARSTAPIPMGTEVFIVVGTYFPTVDGADAQGDYELLVQEITPTPVGMPCTGASVCADPAVCIANPGSTTMGTCIADGTLRGRCRLTGAACEMGLTCSAAMPTMTARGTCLRTVDVGGNCAEAGTICATGASCQASNPADPAVRTCVANGTQGGACRADSPRCEAGLECASGTAPTCRAPATPGGACDPQNVRTFCPSGSTCVPGAMAGMFTCVANGTAAGTACRSGALADGGVSTPCDTGFDCSATTSGVCRRPVAMGGACDLRYNTTACATGTACSADMPGSAAGTCTAPTREMEPNNTPAMANPTVTRSTIFTGAVTPEDDVDCFNVTVPANASLRVTTATPTGTCALAQGEDSIVEVFRAGSTTAIATNDDIAQGNLCSRLDGTAGGALNRLAAGTYAVCVSSYQGAPIAAYTLTVDLFPAAN